MTGETNEALWQNAEHRVGSPGRSECEINRTQLGMVEVVNASAAQGSRECLKAPARCEGWFFVGVQLAHAVENRREPLAVARSRVVSAATKQHGIGSGDELRIRKPTQQVERRNLGRFDAQRGSEGG